MRRFLPILLLLLAVSSPAWAARTATADTTGNWGTAANWDGPDTLPATGDSVIIPNGVAITLNGAYPAAGAFLQVTVQAGGTLTIPVDANSGLTLSGDSAVGFTVAGIMQTAGSTVGNPVALGAGITCNISIVPATDGGSGVIITSTGANYVAISGAVKTHFVLLGDDVGNWSGDGDAAYDLGGTLASVTTATTPTGWLDHDIVVIAPTGRTYSHWEAARLNGAASSTTVAVEGWHTLAEMSSDAPTYLAGTATVPQWNHQGTGGAGVLANARAEVLNLTRSFRIFSTDNTKRCYISTATTAVVAMSYVEAYSCGTTTAAKRALSVLTTTGSVTGTGCVFHDGAQGIAVTALTTGTFTPTNWIAWGWGASGGDAWNISALTLSGAGALTATNCIGAYTTTAAKYGLNLGDVGSTFPSFRAIGNVQNGVYINEGAAVVDGLLDNAVSHSNGGSGIYLSAGQVTLATSVSGIVAWRNGGAGIQIAASYDTWFASPVLFGNTTQDVQVYGAMWLSSPTITADPAFSTTYDGYAQFGNLIILGGTIKGKQNIAAGFRVTTIGTAHTTFVAPNFSIVADDGQSSAEVMFHKATDDHRYYYKYGYVLSNTLERHTASGLDWQHNTTGGAAVWFRPNITFSVRAKANQALTVKAWVARSGTNDGTAAPRIVILGGYLTGVAADIVGDSYTYAPKTVAAAGVPGASRTTNVVTITTTAVHSLTTGDKVVVGGVTDTSFDGSFTVASTPTTTTFTYAQTAANATSGAGWVGKWQQLTVSASGASTPTETGLLYFCVEGQGSAGYYLADDLSAVGAGAGKPEDYAGALQGWATVGPPGVGGWW